MNIDENGFVDVHIITGLQGFDDGQHLIVSGTGSGEGLGDLRVITAIEFREVEK